jgi:xylose isomerase
LALVETVKHLGELGAYGVSLRDDDLVPPGSSAAERDAIVGRFRQALESSGMVASMATTNLVSNPVFRDGAFTANDRAVRRCAIGKAMRGIDLGGELGARIYVLWGGPEGAEVFAAKAAIDTLERYREAINIISAYALDQGYDLRFAIESEPNEPKGGTLLPTLGHALAFIETLDHPGMVGVNPRAAHETTAGLSLCHAVAQAIWMGKLFHIDLGGHKIGWYDQDLGFASQRIKEAFHLVQLLESSGYTGPKNFGAYTYRVEDPDGVWEAARGCMRSYLILAREGPTVRGRPGDSPSPGGVGDTRALQAHARGLQLRGRTAAQGRGGRCEGSRRQGLPEPETRPTSGRASAGRSLRAGPRLTGRRGGLTGSKQEPSTKGSPGTGSRSGPSGTHRTPDRDQHCHWG